MIKWEKYRGTNIGGNSEYIMYIKWAELTEKVFNILFTTLSRVFWRYFCTIPTYTEWKSRMGARLFIRVPWGFVLLWQDESSLTNVCIIDVVIHTTSLAWSNLHSHPKKVFYQLLYVGTSKHAAVLTRRLCQHYMIALHFSKWLPG